MVKQNVNEILKEIFNKIRPQIDGNNSFKSIDLSALTEKEKKIFQQYAAQAKNTIEHSYQDRKGKKHSFEFNGHINLLFCQIFNEMLIIDSYLNFSEKYHVEIFRKLVRQIGGRKRKYDFYNDLENDVQRDSYFALGFTFPEKLRYSIFVYLWSLFENWLYNICDYLQKMYSKKTIFDEMKGSKIENAKKYFKDVIGLRISLDGNWNFLLSCNKIRHVLVHNNGIISGTKYEKEIRRFVAANKKNVRITIKSNWHNERSDALELKRGFSFECTKIMRVFLYKIYKSIENYGSET